MLKRLIPRLLQPREVSVKKPMRPVNMSFLTSEENARFVHEQALERDWSASKVIDHLISSARKRSEDDSYFSD